MTRLRPRWPFAIAVALALTFTSAAQADQGAEAFVTEKANEALHILNDSHLSLADKKQQFRTLIDQIADVPKITRFVLGRYARSADAADMAAFSDVFRHYAIGVYESRLGEYGGQTLKVTGSTDRRPGDTIVHSEIDGGGQEEPLPVDWRVLTGPDGDMKVVDVEVYGVWLAINQRDEIVSVIQNNGGQISAATQALQGKLAELDVSG